MKRWFGMKRKQIWCFKNIWWRAVINQLRLFFYFSSLFTLLAVLTHKACVDLIYKSHQFISIFGLIWWHRFILFCSQTLGQNVTVHGKPNWSTMFEFFWPELHDLAPTTYDPDTNSTVGRYLSHSSCHIGYAALAIWGHDYLMWR